MNFKILHVFIYIFFFLPSAFPISAGELYIWIDENGGRHITERQISAAPTKMEALNDYFRAANENVGALDCNVVIHARDVDEGKNKVVRKRDGNRCVICGSTKKLEIDHKRALQNGGTNDLSNLALLCDECHTAKTKFDNSLRRKRDSICRKK